VHFVLFVVYISWKERRPTVTRTSLGIAFAALGVAGAFVGALPVYGHHAFAIYYFEEQMISIEGEIVELEYQNPHAWVHVSAPDSRGQIQKYGAEWSNPGRLSQQGITRDTLRPGDRVILSGSPARDPGAYKLHLKRIERPADGWKWIGRGQPR
jgi:hypothetical protein